ncbi:MAG TPA: VCBS repeat-containing protein, partial [Thermoanaerobaculia bacterium]|nr:VCBS repeat-containing protein [Thermoanaerobaculia bacterium]
VDGRAFNRRDIKDVDFGDLDNDGDLDVLDVSSPTQPGFPGSPVGGAGLSPTGCAAAGGDPVNFPDRLFVNDGAGHFGDITGAALPSFHSFRTYDADLVDVNNDGYLDLVRADRALCSGEAHYFVNTDTGGDGVPDNSFTGRSLAPPAQDVYWDNLATGDVEPDGDLDLLVSHSWATTAPHALMLNDGTGIFVAYATSMAGPHSADDDFIPYQAGSHDMYLVDLDGDRDQDIVIGGGNHSTPGADHVLLNRRVETGNLFFDEVPILRAGETTETVSLGVPDVNGDGRPDVHFVNMDLEDRLFLNLGRVGCGSPEEASCPDGLSCSATSPVVANRICWSDATARLPEVIAGTTINGYGSDYGDIDADGDLDMIVTGLGWGSGNYLFLNQTFAACPATPCPTGYDCIAGGCRPTSAAVAPNWASCPPVGSGATLVPCVDRTGSPVTGPGFPGVQVPDRDLAVVFGDVDGDVDLDIIWGRGQWGDWMQFPDSGPLLLMSDGERPYVKRVTVLSGPRIVYQAAWAPNGAGTDLVVAPASFAAAAPFTALRTQDLHVEVEFSEPMATASLTAVTPQAPAGSLGIVPTLASSQPVGAQTVWRGTISNLDIADDGSHDGTHMITIAGADLVGNQLLQIASRTNIAIGALRGGTAGNDTIHGFRIGPLTGTIPVTAIFMKQGAADPGSPTIPTRALNLQTALNHYFGEVSYGSISFAVTGVGWYQLDHAVSWYDTLPRTPLVDLVQEALDDAGADPPGATALATTNYVLVVTEDISAPLEWS